jgi:hypothetical protein
MTCILVILAPFLLLAEQVKPIESSTIWVWFSSNWSLIALFASEAIAFIPIKAQGLAHGIISIFSAIFKKKSPSSAKSKLI